MAWNPASTAKKIVSGDEDPKRAAATYFGGGVGNAIFERYFGAGSPGGGPAGSPMAVPGRPDRPEFGSLQSGGQTSLLGGDLKLGDPRDVTAGTVKAGKSTYDVAKLGTAGNALVDRATATGPSAWLTMQQEKLGQDQTNALNTATQSAAGAGANARTQLAMRGGLSGGARERLASAGARDLNQSQNAIANQGANLRTQLGIADETQKMGLLGQAAGMETGLSQFNAGNKMQNSQFNVGNDLGAQKFNVGTDLGAQQFNVQGDTNAAQYNIGNAIGEVGQQRQNDLNVYSTDMQERAGILLGNETLKGGGAGKK